MKGIAFSLINEKLFPTIRERKTFIMWIKKTSRVIKLRISDGFSFRKVFTSKLVYLTLTYVLLYVVKTKEKLVRQPNINKGFKS